MAMTWTFNCRDGSIEHRTDERTEYLTLGDLERLRDECTGRGNKDGAKFYGDVVESYITCMGMSGHFGFK